MANQLKIYSVIILISGIFIVGCKKNIKEGAQSPQKRPPVLVDVLIADNINLPNTIELNGNVLPQEMIEIRPEVSGRITQLMMNDGASVAAGGLLARINNAELQAQQQQLQVQFDMAVKTEQRLKKLLEINGVNQADYDQALNQVNLITANKNILQAQLDKTEIRAPFSGVLGLRQISNGAYVTPNTILTTLQSRDQMKIDFLVPESYLSLLKLNQKINVSSPHFAEIFSATIIAFESNINNSTNNAKVRAKLHSNKLKAGSFVKINLDKSEKGIVVPTNAIIPDALSNQVVVVRNGKGMFQNVKTGIRNANVVQITEGIKQGDSIVIGGVLFVRPNAELKIKQVKSSQDFIEAK
jgi:membrane fusion protein (multidrug efflux system)